jgi:lipid-A-disaccharide synthase
MSGGPLKVFLAAGESSGDQLGARLMAALREATGGAVAFSGFGGPAMQAGGLDSLFPASDIAVMGPRAIAARLPLILRRLRETVAAVDRIAPDVLVLVDSPEFTQRVAKRVRRRRPDLTIVKYVAPQVWAWRPGRAPKMRGHLDRILALLPFEPEVYARLGGPVTSYVGHPLIEQRERYRPSAGEALRRDSREHPSVLVLPGSRVSEVTRLMDDFGRAISLVAERFGPIEPVIPAVPHLRDLIRAKVAPWPVAPRIVEGDADKLAAFRGARAALAASGTVTLELALAGVPSVVAYRIEPWLAPLLKGLIDHGNIVLANLVLGRKVMPQFLQWQATPEALAGALEDVLRDGPARDAQLRGLAETPERLALVGETPSQAAARAVLEAFETKTGRSAPRS